MRKKTTGNKIFKKNSKEAIYKEERELLSFLFTEVFPKYGMGIREKQVELAQEMLAALQENKIALCEAEVGTGKTHAYILAVTVFNLYSKIQTPAVISTSTIALQKALVEEYIPQISAVLLKEGIIRKPLTFVVRKGKTHYVCDNKLQTYYRSIQHLQREDQQELLRILEELAEGSDRVPELDGKKLSAYEKARICVAGCNETCKRSASCRYSVFSRACLSGAYDFQIANHNYVLADILNKKSGRKALLPRYQIMIFDEAHKIVDAAKQMYGIRFADDEIPQLISYVSGSIFPDKGVKNTFLLTAMMLHASNERIFRMTNAAIRERHTRENNRAPLILGRTIKLELQEILQQTGQLEGILLESGVCTDGKIQNIHRMCQTIQRHLREFLEDKELICWVEKNEKGGYQWCAIPKFLSGLLYADIWNSGASILLTSATMSVGGDFTHFMDRTGIDSLPNRKVLQTSKPSPFDYRNHALLYIPERMPFPNVKEDNYREAVKTEIRKLIAATRGHTLILFTSYSLMERIYYEMTEEIRDYPLFMMGRGRLDIISAFRGSKNGVLFASDSAGEGIDLAGDILSSVIVVKLPFPIPDPVSEYEKEQFEDFKDYLAEAVTPDMIIKLRQWIGRGIRREEDTAVFSILDSRAGSRGRYRRDILSAIPAMPITDTVDDVERFIQEKKGREYFLDKE